MTMRDYGKKADDPAPATAPAGDFSPPVGGSPTTAAAPTTGEAPGANRLEALEGRVGLLLAGPRPIGHGQVPFLEVLVRFGPSREQSCVLRLPCDRLGVFVRRSFPVFVCRVQIADAGDGCRATLQQLIERRLVAEAAASAPPRRDACRNVNRLYSVW